MTTAIKLPNGRKIGHGEPAFIVAEIGQNHDGDVYQALRLAVMAHECGVDAVKLCKRHLPSDMTRAAFNRPYCNPHSYGPTYGRHREKLELDIGEYVHLKERMRYNELAPLLFATACDIHSVKELQYHLDPPLWKLASRDLDNLPLIAAMAKTKKPIVLSTGMARDDREITTAINVAKTDGSPVIVCYCLSEYPTPDEHVWLPRLEELRLRHGVLVGFSDHTVGIHFAQAAVMLGAVYVEKHATYARAGKGTDHAASLERDGLRRLVRNIRTIEYSLRLEVQPEIDVSATRCKLGRSLVTARTIRKGETVDETMLCLKSPGDGIPWRDRERVLGKTARRTIPGDTTLEWADVMETVTAEVL
jgi:sialic acid synthase